ncbi:DUF2863 family protein, partial [Klebsiella pneumoniae]|uniref:DUF2863 family protein n=1 Tax=Klebsiella pneumoniae TaxID=573 RepID=UPI003B5CCE26
ASGSRIEDRFWEAQLDTLLTRVLRTGNQPAIDAALDHLQANHSEAYGALADLIESQSESASGRRPSPGLRESRSASRRES